MEENYMSSFLDSTGLSRLVSKITDYFAKKDGTYPNMTVGKVVGSKVGEEWNPIYIASDGTPTACPTVLRRPADISNGKLNWLFNNASFVTFGGSTNLDIKIKPTNTTIAHILFVQNIASSNITITAHGVDTTIASKSYAVFQWNISGYWEFAGNILSASGTYRNIISGELYNASVKWDAVAGRGELLTYNYPADNTTGVIVYLSAFDTSSNIRGDAILKITGRGNTFNAKIYHLTGTHFRGYINIEVTVDSTNRNVHVYCYSGHAEWMYVCGTLLFEGAWSGNQYKVNMMRNSASSSTQKVGSDVSINSYFVPYSAGTGAGSISQPVYVNSEGSVKECALSLNATYVRTNSSSYDLYTTLKPSSICCAILHNATNASSTITIGSGVTTTIQSQTVAVFVWDGTRWYKMPYSS
jgi:hypothetical protein